MNVPYKTLLAVGCFSLATTSMSFAQTSSSVASNEDKKAPEAAEKPVTTVSEDSHLGRMAMTLKNYFAAKSPQERLSFILDPEKNEPLMRDFYFREAYIPGNLTSMSTPEAVALDGVSYWRSSYTLADNRTGIVFLRISDGSIKIDWPSQAFYSPVKWDEWLTKNDAKATNFRVIAKVDTYYPEAYSDRSKFVCVQLSSTGSTNTIFAYMDVTKADQREFVELIANGGSKDCTLTLKLDEKKEGSTTIPTASVEKVVSPSWIVPGGGI